MLQLGAITENHSPVGKRTNDTRYKEQAGQFVDSTDVIWHNRFLSEQTGMAIK